MEFRDGKIGYDLLIWYPNLFLRSYFWLFQNSHLRGLQFTTTEAIKKICLRLLKVIPKLEFQTILE